MPSANRLGGRLQRLRRKRKDSLRAVEAQTGISNAYLSQLERGVATNPNPVKLQQLARYFGIPYVELMRDAGYMPAPAASSAGDLIAAHAEPATALSSELTETLSDLTDDEETLVMQYAEFLKSRRERAGQP